MLRASSMLVSAWLANKIAAPVVLPGRSPAPHKVRPFFREWFFASLALFHFDKAHRAPSEHSVCLASVFWLFAIRA